MLPGFSMYSVIRADERKTGAEGAAAARAGLDITAHLRKLTSLYLWRESIVVAQRRWWADPTDENLDAVYTAATGRTV